MLVLCSVVVFVIVIWIVWFWVLFVIGSLSW